MSTYGSGPNGRTEVEQDLGSAFFADAILNRPGNKISRKWQKRRPKIKPGLANFSWIVLKLKLLSSEYSCLRLVNTFTKIFSSPGGCNRLNIVKPKNGLATNNNTANQKYILAFLYWYMLSQIKISCNCATKFNRKSSQIRL